MELFPLPKKSNINILNYRSANIPLKDYHKFTSRCRINDPGGKLYLISTPVRRDPGYTVPLLAPKNTDSLDLRRKDDLSLRKIH
jgi:hypothetical protein